MGRGRKPISYEDNCKRIEQMDDGFKYTCGNGVAFLFDACDLALVQKYNWYIHCGYPKACIGEKTIIFSRIVMSVADGEYIDHINGDRLDNRRCNLRVVSMAENCRNRGMNLRNRSGYKGISHQKSGKAGKKFKAEIRHNGRKVYLGLYDNAIDAAKSYDTAARKFYGEFACVNFPREGERGCREVV